jgi:protein-S-isoprenylcysteine O-methyltransferase Ste14
MTHSIRKTFIILLASAGIRIDKMNNSRVDSLLLILVGYGSHLFIAQYVNFAEALGYYLILFLVRYIYLFSGFGSNGFAFKMISKYGEDEAWNKYELVTSIMFFQRGLSFGLLTHASQWSLIDLVNDNVFLLSIPTIETIKTVSVGLGLLLVAIGFWVNTAATFVIGIDTYYYKDLFLKRAIVDFKVEGPYKYFSNPMYGIGQSSAYGAALMVGSIAGILATVLNQLVMYVFYYTIEKPHIKSIISAQQKLTPSISDQPVLIDSKEYEIYA